MALIQIAEPGEATAPHQHRLSAGIDLGTTNSLVATVRSGHPETLADNYGERLLPSVVHYGEQEILVGQSAVALAVSDPLNTIASAKRLIGRGVADIKKLGSVLPYEFVNEQAAVPRLKTRAGDISPIEVSAEILKVLSKRVEATLGDELSGVVITVPAYFDEAQRQATKDAATLAGLNVFRLLNEPTAAAVAYGLDTGADGLHAIYDLGGGTFDISILRLHKGVFEVISTGGDSALGGDDIDHVIADWIGKQAGLSEDIDYVTQRSLLSIARTAKETLSVTEEAAVTLELENHSPWQGVITRDGLNELADPLLKKTINACRRALRDAGVSKEDIKDVVLVGGSTRLYRVRELVAEFFGRQPMIDIDPDSVVAIGAAIQADVLAGNKPDTEMLLLDVNPLSLGIETMGGLVEKIIHRNTAIPVAKAQEFTTFKDGQTAMAVHVLQGERDLVKDCRSLARFELRGIPPMVAGAARIRVTFTVDADGLLSVEASEETSGINATVTVKPSYGLTDNEISDMLQASMDHAVDDKDSRKLAEYRVDAARVIEALRAALASDAEELLSKVDLETIEEALSSLESYAEGDDADAIEAAIKLLEQRCEFYVERRMNVNIRTAMAGHNINEFE